MGGALGTRLPKNDDLDTPTFINVFIIIILYTLLQGHEVFLIHLLSIVRYPSFPLSSISIVLVVVLVTSNLVA